MTRAGPLPSVLRLWCQEQAGRLLWLGTVVVGAALVVLYFADLLPERAAGLLLAIGVVLASCLLGLRGLLQPPVGRLFRGLAVAVVLATATAALVPVISTLTPGTPAAHGMVAAPGDSLALDPAAHGLVRLLLHGAPAGRGEASVDLALDVGQPDKIHGVLSRTLSRGRVARRVQTTVVHEHDSEYVETEIPAGTPRITLASVHGFLAGPVQIDVFPERLSFRLELLLAGGVLVAAALLAARRKTPGSGVGALGCALAFGLMVCSSATPDAAVQAEIGAAIVAALAGGLAGWLLVWILRKTVGPRLPGPTPSPTV